MMRSTSTVETEHASRYLQQLCKHWSHRFTVTFDAAQGTIVFPAATLGLAAETARLHLTLDAEDAAELPRLGTVVSEHLRRFAFREDLVIDWSPAET